jgi:hypothetical protein
MQTVNKETTLRYRGTPTRNLRTQQNSPPEKYSPYQLLAFQRAPTARAEARPGLRSMGRVLRYAADARGVAHAVKRPRPWRLVEAGSARYS